MLKTELILSGNMASTVKYFSPWSKMNVNNL